jgi:astacin (peptidase family M12A)
MAMKSQIHLCIDRIIPIYHKIEAMEHAVRENPHNMPKTPKLMPGASNHRAKMALFAGKMWPDGRTLGVAFLDGSKIQRQKVMEHALEWTKYANINFDFRAGKKAEVRISFNADPGSWSAIGTDCLVTQYFPKSEPTINFGWLEDDTDDTEYRRVVVHEFGHALGCIHEHQNPKGGIRWNEDAVYKYFSGPPNNWSREEIYHNVIEKYSSDQLNATRFDSKSIMLYSFPKEFIKGPASLAKRGTAENTKLSAGDKRYIKKMYPQ